MASNILEEVQDFVARKLNADSELSSCVTFLAENKKDIDFEIKNALGKQGIVGCVLTPKATYQGKYEDLFLAWQLDELEIDVVENPIVNRGRKNGYMTGQDAAMKVFQVLCPLAGEDEGQFNPVSYEEGEDNGLLVNKCVLKTLVYGEHQDEPGPEPELRMKFVKLLDEPPPEGVQPRDGWMWREGTGFKICQGETVYDLGVAYDVMSAYVESRVSSKAEISDVADVSADLAGLQDSLSGYYLKSETSSAAELDTEFAVKADLSALNEVADSLSGYYVKSETSSSAEIQAALDGKQPSGDYALVSQLPTKTSELSNDSGFITNSSISAFKPYADDEFDTKAFINQWNAETGSYDLIIKSCRLSGEITRDIANNAFYPIANVFSIKFGTGVTGISDGALSGFDVLREVYFRNTTKRIGDSAFQNCPQLARVEFEPIAGVYPSPNEISAEALQIGISAFANDAFLYYVRFPALNKMLIGRDAFKNTFRSDQFAGLCPYKGIYFDGLLATQATLDHNLSVYYLAELSGLCHPWNTVSKEYIDSLNYGKDFGFYQGIDYVYANRIFSWSIKNKTIYNANISSLPAARTKRVSILQDDTDHVAREMYVDLSTDVTIAETSLFVTGAAVDWYLNGELSTFKDEFFKAGTHFIWHFMEYRPNHFMVEKVGSVEQSLLAKADLSALDAVENSLSDYALVSQIPLSVSQLENDAGYLTAHQPLSDYYTKGETSSDAEIGAALGLKQDKLTDEQMANASTKCLPLNLSGNTAISGNNYLDFHCLPRFFAPVVMNGALDVKQLNIVNYDVDSYTALSAIDEDTIEFVGGFNREHIAVLNLKNGTIAYVSDIEQAVSSKADLSAVESALSDYYAKTETSSATEIQTALNGKQDKLSDAQISAIDTPCLPLNLSGNTAISGNNYLDFRCLARFFSPVVMNGALDVKQLNIVNYEVDSYTSLSAMDEDTIEFVGGFNREHIAVLNLKNDTIAYISDISAMYEARISALEARIAALECN